MKKTDPRAIIDSYNSMLFDIYQREELQALGDNHYTYKGISVIALSNPAIVRAGKVGLHKSLKQVFTEVKGPLSDKNFYYAETELFSLTGEIKYRIGTLYLYHPYILQLKYSYCYHKGKKHFIYDQTLEDARFNREIPIAFESIGKYWQRISDYLSSFFPEVILKLSGRTYFNHPFEHICSKYPSLMNS